MICGLSVVGYWVTCIWPRDRGRSRHSEDANFRSSKGNEDGQGEEPSITGPFAAPRLAGALQEVLPSYGKDILGTLGSRREGTQV